MRQYHRTKLRAQQLQEERDAEIKREAAARKEKDLAAAKDVEAVSCPRRTIAAELTC